MLKIHQKLKHSFAARFSGYLLLLVGLIFSLTFIVSFAFSNRMVKSKMEQNADLLLQLLNKEIENVLEQVQGTPDNLKNIVLSNRLQNDDFYKLTAIAVENNPFIYGSAIAFEPNYFPEQGYYFSPYSWRIEDSIHTKQLGTDHYPYFEMEWYAIPKKLNAGHWSNSYYDEEGGDVQMITYSAPIMDSTERFVGVFTADLSLSWLNELVKSKVINKQFQIVIIGRDSVVLAVQGNERDLSSSLFTYYTAIPQTGWTIFLSIPHKVMYAELSDAKIILLAIGITGLLLIFIFSIRVVKQFVKPLKHFSVSAKQIAAGRLNIPLPEIKSEDEIAELNKSFRYMQSELLHYIENLKIITAEKERIDSEIRIARELQLDMLPKRFPDEIDLYAVLRPAKFVSGDLYDFFIRKESLYFILGDVSGKGAPAALLMAVTLNMFRTISSYVAPIRDVVTLMNKVMVENNEQNMFITLFAGILDLKTGVLHYCNAGHDPAIIINNDVQYLPVIPNLPIGILSDFEYQAQEVELNYGETLILYTDVITYFTLQTNICNQSPAGFSINTWQIASIRVTIGIAILNIK
jgi:sigma-B regulation protein RsbU (phosphoserine phosphatase)